MNLTPDDVEDLREIIRFADRNQTERGGDYLRQLKEKEGRLSPAAHAAWSRPGSRRASREDPGTCVPGLGLVFAANLHGGVS